MLQVVSQYGVSSSHHGHYHLGSHLHLNVFYHLNIVYNYDEYVHATIRYMYVEPRLSGHIDSRGTTDNRIDTPCLDLPTYLCNLVHVGVSACAEDILASITGRTEDGPGIDCLRMHHICLVK